MADLKSITYLPSTSSTDQDWIAWYNDLLTDVGYKNANQVFMAAWNQRKNEDPIFGSAANTQALRDFLKTHNLTLSADGAFGFAYNALDTVEDWASSAFNTTKWVLIIGAVVLIIPIFVLLISIARDPRSISGAVKVA